MSEKKNNGTGGQGRFGNGPGEELWGVEDLPGVDRETGEVCWPAVEKTDGCCWFCRVGGGGDGATRRDDACVARTTEGGGGRRGPVRSGRRRDAV